MNKFTQLVFSGLITFLGAQAGAAANFTIDKTHGQKVSIGFFNEDGISFQAGTDEENPVNFSVSLTGLIFGDPRECAGAPPEDLPPECTTGTPAEFRMDFTTATGTDFLFVPPIFCCGSDGVLEFLPTDGGTVFFSVDGDLLPDSGNGSAVPEPASWAMMVGGFGILGGGAMRRRKSTVVYA